ncbi:MAG: hypothetical protein WAX89_00950, partial [Alphaproteobacteria bacterium]
MEKNDGVCKGVRKKEPPPPVRAAAVEAYRCLSVGRKRSRNTAPSLRPSFAANHAFVADKYSKALLQIT